MCPCGDLPGKNAILRVPQEVQDRGGDVDFERHGGRALGFGMKVTGVLGGDALKRQVRESVIIQ